MSLDITLLDYIPYDVFTINITHNLQRMAMEANLYKYLWNPDDKPLIARDMIIPLEKGLEILKAAPDYFKQFNPENGFGNYEDLVNAVECYITACKAHPNAKVMVWR